MNENQSTEIKKLKSLVFLQFVVSIFLAIALLYLFSIDKNLDSASYKSVTTEQLIVIDSDGTNRVIVSGRVPDPIIRGKVVSRGNEAGGIILYDQDGDERAGFITTDDANNVMLGLDTKDRMTARIAVGAEGGSSLWMSENNQVLQAIVNSSMANLTVSKDGQIVEELVETPRLPPELCKLFKDGIRTENPDGFPRDMVKKACMNRFSEAACEPCLPDS